MGSTDRKATGASPRTGGRVRGESRLAALRERYARGLPDKVARMEELAGRVVDGGDREARDELAQAAHRLSGTAGSYGFDAVGEHAGRIERLLGQAAEVDRGALARCVGALVGAVARLRA